jgi:hypothetical protein
MMRFLRLLGGVAVATAIGSLLIGALSRTAAQRSVSVGFYGVGAFLVLVGLAHFTRGLTRASGELPLRRTELRWATPEEHGESLVSSALFVVLGVALLILGTFFDRRYPLA